MDYLKNQRKVEGLEGPQALPRFDFTDWPKLENINERKKFMDENELSLRKMINDDMRSQKKSVYSRFFINRMFRAIDTDGPYQKIVQNMRRDLVRYFESTNLQSNFQRAVEESQAGFQPAKPMNSILEQR